MNDKLTDKDKKDWNNFASSKDQIPNKDQEENIINNNKLTKLIDLHGFSLESANKVIEKFIINSYEVGVKKIIIVTGKGKRSKVTENPYVSEDLSILKNSVPEYIKSKQYLMKIIKKIEDASVEDGGQGAFYIFLKKFED